MKSTILLSIFLALGIVSCNTVQHKDSSQNADAVKIDTSSRKTADRDSIINPRFDENKIHGLGSFDIGSSFENTLGQLITSGKYLYDSVWSNKQMENLERRNGHARNQIVKVIAPPTAADIHERVMMGYYNFTSYDDKVTSYTLKRFAVDKLNISELVLIYYNDRLISIECESTPELKAALELKFGKPDRYGNYKNGDLKAGEYSSVYRISARGVSDFLQACNDKAFAIRDSIEKSK